MITPTQMRAARAMLDVPQGHVAEHLGIAANTLSKIESGQSDISMSRNAEIQRFYEREGIAFTDNDGVKWEVEKVHQYVGKDGLVLLMDDTYSFASGQGGEIRLYNARPENWLNFVSVEWFKNHAKRMIDVKDNFSMRIFAEDGNEKLISSFYAVHRWFPEDLEVNHDQSIYIYGDKLGFVDFSGSDVKVTILKNADLAGGMKALFDVAWDNVGVIPPFGEKLQEVDFSFLD
ncbi:MAG: helix-turn-helix transcriptional regulator [Pseudomonadota bacterium]